MNWRMSTVLRDWMFRRNCKRSLDAGTAAWSPEFFRRVLRVCDGDRRTFGDRMLDWQARDLRALDGAWLALAGLQRERRSPPGPQPWRAYLERPRGHSKTFDTAVQAAWILIAARRAVRGLCAAADQEQALLVRDAMDRLARCNESLLEDLKFRATSVTNQTTGSRMDFLSSDVASSWGHDPDFVVCDELCHWARAEMWQSLVSSAAKRKQCVLLVLSNAGVGRGWQWDVREAARTSPGWYFSTLSGPQAPWITPEHLTEQERLLPRPVYERLWLNIWQTTDGEFVTLAEAEACCDPLLSMRHHGVPQHTYVASIDYAEKHDLTVGCVCHREADQVVVDRMDVVRPSSGRPTQVRWVSDWMSRIAADFSGVQFVVDDYQLVGVVQQMEQMHSIKRFSFQGGHGNHALALLLRRLIVERKVVWYPGCGSVAGEEDEGVRDDLETELAGLIVRQRAGGHLRIDHPADGRSHDDRSFALGAACLELLSTSGRNDYFEVQRPRTDGGFDW